MKRILLITVSLLLIATALPAQTAPDGAELTKLLQDFLAGASKNDIAMHDRLKPKAPAAEVRFLGVITRRDGELVVADGTDDVTGEIFAAEAVAAARCAVEETDLAAEPNLIRRMKIDDPIDR